MSLCVRLYAPHVRVYSKLCNVLTKNCFSTVYLETQREGEPRLIIFRLDAMSSGPVVEPHSLCLWNNESGRW